MNPVLVAAAAVAVAAGASCQVAVGFGFGLLAAPFLVAVDPVFVPGPAILVGMLLSIWTFWRERTPADLPGLRWAWAGRVPGTAVGAAVLTLVPPGRTAVVVAVVILAAVGLSLLRWRPVPTPRVLLAAGFVSGVMATTASTGGPPLALVHQHASGPQLRSAMSGALAVGAAVSLAALVAAGRFGIDELRAFAVLVVPVGIGVATAPWLATHVDRGGTRKVVLGLSAASAVVLLLREVR